MRANLNQCISCFKTYNMNESGTSALLCATCNDKKVSNLRKKDALRKRENRSNEVSVDLERLAGIDEWKNQNNQTINWNKQRIK